MIDRDQPGKLEIFTHFQQDSSLPKFKIAEEDLAMSEDDFDGMSKPIRRTRNWVEDLRWAGENPVVVREYKLPKAKRALTLFSRLFGKKPAALPPPPPALTVEEFFASVKGSAEEIAFVQERARGYEEALKNARLCGQQALEEQLTDNLVAIRAEVHLASMGLTKYLPQNKLVEFVKQSPRGLRLDWVRNFTRIIPQEVMQTKVACDERNIFDNYAVLHYDPDAKSWAQTEQEKREMEARRRDPVLFGLLKGRENLYFVGDWIDELCNLTFDQIADKIGASTLT
jgi:hypothetical protein